MVIWSLKPLPPAKEHEENAPPTNFEDRQSGRREPGKMDGQRERVTNREVSHQFYRLPRLPSTKDGTVHDHVQMNITWISGVASAPTKPSHLESLIRARESNLDSAGSPLSNTAAHVPRRNASRSSHRQLAPQRCRRFAHLCCFPK